MYFVKVKLNNSFKYIYEKYNHLSSDGLALTDCIRDGALYSSKYDLMVALKILGMATNYMGILNSKSNWYKEKKYNFINEVEKWYLIDSNTLEEIEFDINEKVEFKEKELYFNEHEFNMLKDCFYTCSHFLYNNDNWIAFPDGNEEITHIIYLRRGLVSAINNVYRDRHAQNFDSSIAMCYSFYKGRSFMCLDEQILKLFLDDNIKSCDRFKILKIESKKNDSC